MTTTEQAAARPWAIYVLEDPRDGEVRYVGVSIDPKRRLKSHKHAPRSKTESHTHKARWVATLERDGLAPRLRVIEEGDGDWVEAEMRWIASYRAAGARLTNLSDGGEGAIGHAPTDETRARMAEAQRALGGANRLGKTHTNESKRAISEKKTGVPNPNGAAARTGTKRSAESLAKQSATTMGHAVSDETKRKISAAHMGKIMSAETRARIGAASKGRKRSAESIAKGAAKIRGHECSPETRAKIGAANKGRKQPEHVRQALLAASQTEEVRMKRGKAIAAAWARKREAKALLAAVAPEPCPAQLPLEFFPAPIPA